MRHIWTTGGATGIALALLALAGTATAEEVNVYTSRHYDTDTVIYENFTAETGIEVNVIEGQADELIARIQAEAANSPADLFVTVDGGRLYRAVDAGILGTVESPVVNERIPAAFRNPDGQWFGLSSRVRAIVYAKDRVQPGEMTRYEDLASPAFEGRVCIRSSTNIYNQSLVAAMIESQGLEATEAWAEGVVNNFARPPQGGDRDQIRAIAAGECDVGLTNHYYLARMIAGDKAEDQEAADEVQILFPNQEDRGAHANISGIGMVKTAPNPENAVKLIEYLTTDEAQSQFALGNQEFPIVPGVMVGPVLEDWAGFKADDVNVAAYGTNNAEAVKLMDRVGWQ
jgi:iron(III) transport system substrate-binding protein